MRTPQTNPLSPHLEQRVRSVAASRGEDVGSYVSRAILRQVEADESGHSEDVDRAIEEAAADPMFMADIEEAMLDFRSIDSETSRLLPGE